MHLIGLNLDLSEVVEPPPPVLYVMTSTRLTNDVGRERRGYSPVPETKRTSEPDAGGQGKDAFTFHEMGEIAC